MKVRLDLYCPHPAAWRKAVAGLYGVAVHHRCRFYRSGLFKTHRLPAWVIAVGNLTVGGTGKTPLTVFIARHLAKKGWKTAVLSRGYGRRLPDKVLVVSDGRQLLKSADQAGDEPYLMASQLPGIPVLVGRERFQAGRQAIEQFEAQVLVLDDAFQHLALARDVNLLLVDGEEPWGNGYLLPAGPLRESVTEAHRASAFILTRGQNPTVVDDLTSRFPGRPVLTARHVPTGLRTVNGNMVQEVTILKDRPVAAYCGLARPQVFRETLEKLGARVELFTAWPDHYRPTANDLYQFAGRARALNLNMAVTTAKDAVKIPSSSSIMPQLTFWVLDIDMDVEPLRQFLNLIAPWGHLEPTAAMAEKSSGLVTGQSPLDYIQGREA